MWRVSTVEFLELLAREATAVEFEGPLVAARAAGADPAAIAELETAKLVALRVRTLLARRHRREQELSALNDTASDLAGLRDLDAVLRAIVHRARTLLSADVAYMTLTDDEIGDTFMRVTDGSISAKFQGLRLGLGEGLGGLVTQTGTPYVTADYPRDARFRHTSEIDTGVGEEGLVAILGVPLRLGSRVIGVLYAANRSARPFAREEVSLLVSLAAHAAVAIDTARLLAETRDALEELSAANALIRRQSSSVERAAAAHDRMTRLVLRGGGVADVAAAVTDVLGGALLVLDADGRQLAAVGDMRPPDPAVVSEAVAASRVEGRSVHRGGLWVAAVVAGGEDLGALLLDGCDLIDADQRLLERAALVTALLLLFRRTVAEAESRVRGELLDDLLGGPIRDPDALRVRADRLGVNLDAPSVVVAVEHDDTGAARRRALSWAASYASTRAGLAAGREGRLVLVLPGGDPGAVARTAIRALSRALGGTATPTAGAAGPTTGAAAIPAAYRDATRCLGALIALHRHGEAASTAELGFVGLLLGGERDVNRFLTDSIGPVVDYDTRRGTALVRTLEAYFGVGGSLSRAAEALHVHVNTVTQRLERVGQLLGDDWQRPDRALEVQLALRLHRLRGPLDATAG